MFDGHCQSLALGLKNMGAATAAAAADSHVFPPPQLHNVTLTYLNIHPFLHFPAFTSALADILTACAGCGL